MNDTEGKSALSLGLFTALSRVDRVSPDLPGEGSAGLHVGKDVFADPGQIHAEQHRNVDVVDPAVVRLMAEENVVQWLIVAFVVGFQ